MSRNQKVLIAFVLGAMIVVALCVVVTQSGIDWRELMLRMHGIRR